MQIKIANCVVNSFATTSCNQNGYFVKRQIYERWFERCHQVPANVWESTPLPMPAQGPVVVNTAEVVGVLPTEFDIRLIPVEKIVDNDDENSSTAGNFAPSPVQDENSNDSVEVVYSPTKPVLPLPCVIKKVKKPKPKSKKKHSKKKRHGKKKKPKDKPKNSILVDTNNDSNKISEENVSLVSNDEPGSPGPPPLSPIYDYDDFIEEVTVPMLPLEVEKPEDKEVISQNKKSLKRHSPSDEKKAKKSKPGPAKLNPDRFKCTFCQKKFKQKCNFDAHVRLHTGEKPYKCRICGKAYASQGNKISHEKIHDRTRYEGEPRYSCDMCDRKYHIESALAVHKYRRHNKDSLTPKPKIKNATDCEFCGTAVVDMKYHVEKLHTVSEKKPFKCPICHFTFADDLYLQKHQSVHTLAQLLYQCKMCRRGYNQRFKLNEHLKVVHKITDTGLQNSEILVVPAKECIIGFEDRKKKEKIIKPKREKRGRPKSEGGIAMKHPRSSKVFMCEICGKISTQSYSHLVHIRMHTGEKPYKCKYCDRRFNDAGNRLKHQETHDKSRLEGEPRFECKVCGKKFHLRGTMYGHTRRRHAKIVPRCFKQIECDICGATLANPKSLSTHKKRLHSTTNDTRLLQCVTCLRVFASEYRLKIHKFEHMKEIECEEFKCVHCPQLSHELFSKDNLYKHYKEAHAEVKQEDIVMKKAFKCPECPLTYVLMKSVLEHIGRVHEKLKGPKRIRNRRKKQKLDMQSESETDDDELIAETIKHEKSSKRNKMDFKNEPLITSTRLTRQQATPAKKIVKIEKKVTVHDLLSQCKDLRIFLTRVDEEWYEEIEIKEENF